MQNPFVSVIIPNYCHARYLDQRIQSVLEQTYQNFEVIILDDASPDEGASRAVIEQYRSNPHVSHIVYNKQNSGSTFKQWHKGFELAKGELIWIAESDDYCEKNFLEELMPQWEKYPHASVVESGTQYVAVDGSPIKNSIRFTGETVHTDGISCIYQNLLCSNFYIPNASAVLFRKDFALAIPKDYEVYKAAGDRLFWIYMAEKGDVIKVDKCLNFFRQHDNKVSPVKEKNGIQCRENYQINQYLHARGYVKGAYNQIEFNYYWNYIQSFDFISDAVRQELLELWFGKWCYKSWIPRMRNSFIRLRGSLQIRTRIKKLFR